MNIFRPGTVVATAILIAVCNATDARGSQRLEREVTFYNDTVQLSGALMLPDGPGQYPVVVFLHGSGPHTRDGARPYAQEFVKLGIASLFFDKRGSGKSGGSWITSSLEELAGDALAAIEFLKKQREVDVKRIGFWGVSQAGWVATLAAARSEDVSFMIIISGGGASPRECELFSYGQAFNDAGLSDAEKSEAFEVINAYFRYLATGEGRAELVTRLDSAKSSNWYSLASLDQILPSEKNRAKWSWVASWDPAPDIAKITCPVLLMFGDSDKNVPTAVATQKWREGLENAGNKAVTSMIFPGAGHGIRRTNHSGGKRAPFADGYKEVLLGWLWSNVVDRSAP